jgi:symplekin
MTAIKSNILKRMDTSPTSVRVCAIKFVQKVVQVQTPGVIADPRVCWPFHCMGGRDLLDADDQQRPERNETSITIVPRNDPIMSIPILEAEASGLLDRLLNVFQENSRLTINDVDKHDYC